MKTTKHTHSGITKPGGSNIYRNTCLNWGKWKAEGGRGKGGGGKERWGGEGGRGEGKGGKGDKTGRQVFKVSRMVVKVQYDLAFFFSSSDNWVQDQAHYR